MRFARAAGLAASLAASACATAVEHPLPAPVAPASASVEVRVRDGVWTADPRWPGLVAEIERAAAPALERIRMQTDLTFQSGRGPIVTLAPSAGARAAGVPDGGDVGLRFVDGVRRPLVRIDPQSLLTGEFRAADDLAPLLAEGAILAGAGDREPTAWIVAGVSLVVGGAFDRRIHQRALAGEAVRTSEADLFGTSPGDPVAAGARAKALARTARADRAFARLLDLVNHGKSEDAALSEMGIPRREFLDAATDTERDHAVRAIADDPITGPLRAARTALARHETDRADALLAPLADALSDPRTDGWLAADARLCLAEIALARGETKNARAMLDLANASQKVVRVRHAQALDAALRARDAVPPPPR